MKVTFATGGCIGVPHVVGLHVVDGHERGQQQEEHISCVHFQNRLPTINRIKVND